MTISSTNRKAGPFIGNDSASVFPFAFSVFSAADVYAVQLNTVTSVESPLALGVDYTVTLNADQSANPGGTLTLTAGPLATGLTLTLTTAVTPLQLTDLTNQGGFYPRVITRAFDKLTVLAQQILERLGRSLTLPLSTSANVSTALPVPEANKALVWNSTATGLANYDASQFATSIIGTNRVVDRFLANGTAGPYTLSTDPLNINNTLVFVGGDYRAHNSYTVSGASITFGTTVADGTVVEVVQQLAVTYPVTALSDNVVSTGKVVDGAITLAKLTTAVQALVNGALQADGSVAMTAELPLAGNAVNALGAVPKQQLDSTVSGVQALVAGRNRIINGTFAVNQRAFAGGALSAGGYGHDRWKGGSGGATYTVSGETATITVGTLVQVIEGRNVPEGGAYTLSWTGTAQARVDGGSYAASPITVTGKTADTNTTIEFNTGTVTRVQYEAGSTATTYDRRLYAVELVSCMRYFMTSVSVGNTLFSGNCASGSIYNTTLRFPVLMRATPTMTGASAGAFGFPAVIGSLVAGTGWFTESRTANSTQTPGYYESSWTASAEL